MIQELALAESRTLAECEGVIERGLKTFTEVGNALLQIRDGRLYRESHATFEDYCRERWGFSRIRAHQIIEASAVVQNFEQSGLPAPTVESQARELARVPEPERAQVWAKTIEHTDGKPTAAAIRQIYRPAPVPAPLPAPRPTEGDLLAGAEWSAAPEPLEPEPKPVAPVPPLRQVMSEEEILRAAGKQAALNAYSGAVDGLIALESYAAAYTPPADIPNHYLSPSTVIRRLEAVLDTWKNWNVTR